MTIEVVYENEDLLVLNKPCGIAVQANAVSDIVKEYSELKNCDLHPITRIDQVVSGICLFAKNKEATATISLMLQEGKIQKKYIAIVEGHITKKENYLEDKLLKVGQKMTISNEGKYCKLHYKVIAELERFSKLEITTFTGRFHQIRAQLSNLGHPIKGDLKYKSKRSNKEGGIYLHSKNLSLDWGNGNIQQFEADYPVDKTLYFIDSKKLMTP